MQIVKIVYYITRAIGNISNKIRTIFLFCYNDSKLFAELLYTKNHKAFIESLNENYKDFEVDFSINLDNENVKEAFLLTVEKVKEKLDSAGYYKALFKGDRYAEVIYEIEKIHENNFYLNN